MTSTLQAPKELSCQESFDLSVQALKKDQTPLFPDKKACPVEHRSIAWIYYNRHPGQFKDMVDFIKENPFWPSQDKMREMAEHAISTETPDDLVLDYFSLYPPVTSVGALIYAQRLWRSTPEKSALPKIELIWIQTDFKPKDEETFYHLFKSYLTAEVHHKRLDRLILDGNYYGLKQMRDYISKRGQDIVDYAITFIQKKNSFKLAWTHVPSCYKQYPGLTFQYLKWLTSKNQNSEALNIFEQAVSFGTFKDHPDLLIRYRNYFARHFLHDQDFQKSYEIAERYPIDPTKLKSKVDYVEGEWLAAWLELRKKQNFEKALKRFEALYNLVSTPISRSKMAYWCGRSAEALRHEEEAKSWYGKATQFAHTYYGQISLKKLNEPFKIQLKETPKPVNLSEQESALIHCLKLIAPYGFPSEKEKILLYLAKNGQSDLGEFLVDLCHEINMPHLAVIVAKFMSQKAPVLTLKAYPVLKLSSDCLSHPFIDEALIHSVIRQESNFNTRSISTADARGFMQLMFKTARKVAKKLGISLKKEELTQQPYKNIEIGSCYLSGVLKQFNGNYILALAAYNAGPDKSEEWANVYGNPDAKEVDIIDWIESIPYGETRGYIQRITETLPIYAERLGKKSRYP